MNAIGFRASRGLMAALLLALAACTSEAPSNKPPETPEKPAEVPAKEPTSSARLVVSFGSAEASATLARVEVTLRAPNLPARTVSLTREQGLWSGLLNELPAGKALSLTAEAFDAANTKRSELALAEFTLAADTLAQVVLSLPEPGAPPSVGNAAPRITTLLSSTGTVAPGGQLLLQASAEDPDSSEALTYAWTASAGGFSSPGTRATTWTAPTQPGSSVLTLTVTDAKQAVATLRFTVPVQAASGGGVPLVTFNASPSVRRLTSSSASVEEGSPVTVEAQVNDGDGQALAYQWTASCAGSWTDATSATARFTPDSVPSGSTCVDCLLTLEVEDGQGGATTGSVALCVRSRPVPPPQPPSIGRTRQSEPTEPGQDSVSLSVWASDPQNSALTFTWSADVGVLSEQQHGASQSEVFWKPPACLWPDSPEVSITATVTNALGLSTSTTFKVTGTSCPIVAWGLTGAMGSARQGHTMTLLPSGKVLAIGGEGLASAELYNPETAIWTPTGSMAVARDLHTATLLRNGKVLVVGGRLRGFSVASAELYDPATGAWTSAGSLAEERSGHTATLLRNGKVLVTGGSDSDNQPLKSAELYDPATGTWSSAGTLTTWRRYHTATLLPSGKVLVVSGPTAELYDPATNSWTATGALSTTRESHTATLLRNGKVLVAGGDARLPNRDTTLTTAELYDPASGTWTATGSMAISRAHHTATVLPSGKVLVTGGSIVHTMPNHASCEVYDPATGTWAPATTLFGVRSGHAAVLLPSGQVMVTGGGAQTETEVLGPGHKGWVAAGHLGTVRREGHVATRLPSGKVLIAGGSDGPSTFFETAELYDPASGSWSAAASMSTKRAYPSATLLPSGKVLLAGGFSLQPGHQATAELYDPATGTWAATGSMATGRANHTATLLPSGKVLVTGGASLKETQATAELYDPETGTWASAGSMATARTGHTATLLPSGKVLIVGGYNSASEVGYFETAELYDPATGTWTATGSLAQRRARHTATLLPSGKVLVAGGSSDDTSRYVMALVEVYDPETGTWSSGRPMTWERYDARATLMPSGKVLVSGGTHYAPSLAYRASAELYDPATDTWTPAGTMVGARQVHTVTLLDSGKVLITGGVITIDANRRTLAELFIP